MTEKTWFDEVSDQASQAVKNWLEMRYPLNKHKEKQEMEIKPGQSHPIWGTGVSIELTGDEVAIAIIAYLVANSVHVSGPRTIRVNGELCEFGSIYVDPSGFVIDQEGKRWPYEEK